MLLDTNILIGLLADEQRTRGKVEEWKREGKQLCISAVNIAEVLSFTELDARAVELIRAFTRTFFIIPFEQSIAETAGALRREYTLSFADACIASTALTHNIPLVTRDRGFRKVADLTILEI